MLLTLSVPPDEIEVQEIEQSFVVNLVILQFLNRNSTGIHRKRSVFTFSLSIRSGLIFSFHSGLWWITFLVFGKSTAYGSNPPEGSWCISLCLQESSPPATVDARL